MTMAVNYFPLGYSLANVFLIGMNSFVFAWQNSLTQLSFNIEKNVFSLYQYLLVWISCLEYKKHKLILFSKNNKLEFCRIYCVFKGSHLSTRAWPLHIVRKVYGSSNNFGICAAPPRNSYENKTSLRFGQLEFHLMLGFAFWRVNHNSRYRVNRQINFAHAHFKNRWSGFGIWMLENHMMLKHFS